MTRLGAAPLLLLWALPLLAGLAMLLPAALDGEAWRTALESSPIPLGAGMAACGATAAL